jgi:protein-tyrosine phosphatase
MQESAKKKGIKVRHTSRLIKPSDFEKFDLIIAVNREVLGQLKDLAPPEAFSKLKLACDYSALFPGQDMPDPYYGDASSFDEVVIMSLDVCSGILLQFGEL